MSLMCVSAVFADDSCKDKYSGWYVGAGISYQHTSADVLLDDNFGELNGYADSITDSSGYNMGEGRVGKIGGTVLAGYGDFLFDNFYVGGELTLDISGNKNSKKDSNPNGDEDYRATNVKTRGIIPTLALRLGGYVSEIDSLIYARVGCTAMHNKFESEFFKDQDVTNKKITPILGLGIEKNIFDSFSLRLEYDYRFSSDKTKSGLKGYDENGRVAPDDYTNDVKNKVKGYVVRVVGTYYFK